MGNSEKKTTRSNAVKGTGGANIGNNFTAAEKMRRLGVGNVKRTTSDDIKEFLTLKIFNYEFFCRRNNKT